MTDTKQLQLSLSDLKTQLQTIQDAADTQLAQAETLPALEELRVKYLGRKGEITGLMRAVKDLSETERPVVGALANALNDRLNSLIQEKTTQLQTRGMQAKLASETLDVTMPGVFHSQGKFHPLTQVTLEVCEIFKGMGFEVIADNECPEVETEYYNFEALNFPEDHPARDMQDTFYTTVSPQVLLRSQTSNAQIRYMENNKLPVRVVAPGRVYRNEEVSSRKYVLFHQLEGLLVDENIRFSDLKGVLHEFTRHFFEGERPTRFRASFFPFTEPSAEVDVQCILCEGAGCRTCGHHGWLEILGAGMVDPNVLSQVGIDPEKHTGFAFGMGLERLAMLKYSIENIRQFYTNDLRFLQQFKG